MRRDRRLEVQGGQQSRPHFTQGKLDRPRSRLRRACHATSRSSTRADRQDPTPELAAKVERLKEKVARLGQEMERVAGLEEQMKAAPDGQVSLTDPDARSMATSGRGSGVVGYNVQVAVETEHHLIVAHAVTNAGSDRAQLSGMATGPRRLWRPTRSMRWLTGGYYSSEPDPGLRTRRHRVTLPRPMTSGSKAVGRFGQG